MIEFLLSKHAIEQAELRSISESIIFKTLENPDKIEIDELGHKIFRKIIIEANFQKYNIRVFVNSDKTPNLIKTGYKTTKFSKYL